MSILLGQLSVSKEGLQKILNFLPYPFLVAQVKGEEGFLEFINQKFVQEIGYTIEDMPTIQDWRRLAYPDESYRNEVLERWNGLLREAKGRNEDSILMQIRIHTKQNAYRWYEVKAALLENIQLVAFIDIHDSKSQEENLKRHNENRDRILSILGHDLRGPLLHVYLLSSMALNQQLSQEEFLKMISDVNVKAFQSMEFLATTLAWAKTNFDSIQVHYAEVNLEKIIEEMLQLYEGSYKAKQLVVAASIPAEFKLKSDPEMLTGVMRNLISNAIKFTHSKGTIHIRAKRVNATQAELEVIDSGVGMDAKKIQQIHNEHYSSHVGTLGERGLGIGLILSKDLLQRLGSELQIESQPGKGTTMRIVLHEPA